LPARGQAAKGWSRRRVEPAFTSAPSKAERGDERADSSNPDEAQVE
jgi:hypothetical protein